MRGDSIRDFYAKTLALLGLGVLAGTGALVDYWPAGVTLPLVAPPRTIVEMPEVLLADEVGQPVFVPGTPVRRTVPDVVQTAAVRAPVSVAAATPVAPPTLAIPVTTLVRTGTPARLIQPAPEPAYVFADALQDRVDQWAMMNIALDVSPRDLPVPIQPAADGDDGLIFGAFKKTGSSIVRTGAITGASFMDAVRLMTSAVKRALPNN